MAKLFTPILAILVLVCTSFNSPDELNDEETLRLIYDLALTEGDCYENLRVLCKDIGGRLSGSPEAEQAVQWGYDLLNSMPIVDTVWLQETLVPVWKRGEPEVAWVKSQGEQTEMNICALGHSIATPEGGITAQVVEVFNFEDLDRLGTEGIEGKIVFYNRPMEPRFINTFHSYGGCVDQRSSGAAEAAPYGALAIVVRSMNLREDDLPHTGVQRYEPGVRQIPAAAISTEDATALSKMLKEDPNLEFHMEMFCENLPPVISHNVIADIKGSEEPDEVILVSGHLDSWDNSEGAHDDGAGVVHSIEVLNLFAKAGIKPKHTIRCVLWMNEENGAKGAEVYAQWALKNQQTGKEMHLAAIESDRGGFTPRGFTIDGSDGSKEKCMAALLEWAPLLKPYDLHYYEYGYSGVDINKMKEHGFALMGFIPDSQRYFDHHHAPNDVFEAVNKRELELGSASITALVYLIDKYEF